MVIVEYFILASNTFLIILEHMHMSISTAYGYMYSVVTIFHVYISYSDEA